MKFIIYAAAAALLILTAGCGSKTSNTRVVSLTEMIQEQDDAQHGGEAALDYESLSDEQKQTEILKVLKKIISTQSRDDDFLQEVFTENLRSKIYQGWVPCVYADGDENLPAEPVVESVTITKFNAATGEVTYTLDVKWEDLYDNTSGTRKLTEKATFKIEDGKLKMDKTDNLQMFA